MIETLKLQNFKILRDVEVKLRPLTVIVGPNGSGKSSVLQALSCVMGCFSNPSPHTVDIFETVFSRTRSPEVLSSREARGLTTLECSGWFGGKFLKLVFSFARDSHRFSSFMGNWGDEDLGSQLSPEVRKVVGEALVLKLEVEKLAAPTYPKDVSLALPSDGEGLSSILAGLHLEDLERFRNLVEKLKEVIPEVRNITLKRVKRERVGFEILFDMKGGADIPAFAVSDGTLLTLGLMTALETSKTAKLMLIDDLERSLHPRALKDLVRLLRRTLEKNPELQIVATSHSPYLLDFFAAEEILLTSLGEDGYAAIKPLTDHPEYERWKDVMAPGEFWSTVGESWVTQQDAARAPSR
jgi:energy-coupling factor transporter ATP-binding protein EcfA2